MLNLILLLTLYFSPSLDDGIGIDPNGGACTTSTLAGDRGAGLDPDGRD